MGRFKDKRLYEGINQEQYKALLKLTLEYKKQVVSSPPYCFSHPIDDFLPLIRKHIQTNKAYAIWGTTFFKVNSGNYPIAVTGAELYRKVIDDIDKKCCMLNEAVHGFLLYKVEVYKRIDKSKRFTKHGQKVVEFNTEYWHLINHIELIIHLFRTVMDLIALLTPVFYFNKVAPNKQSFTSQFDWFSKSVNPKDVIYYNYLNSEIDWFERMRSVRNSVAHWASIDLGFKEFDQSQPEFIICVSRFHKFDEEIRIEHEIDSWLVGLNNFLKFYDKHFSS